MIIQELKDASAAHWRNSIPHISIDSVVFGFLNNQLNVLLLKIKKDDNWILPGGYLQKDEAVDDAAKRILYERSGADKIFLNNFGVFGNLNRSEEYFKDYPDDLWHKQRFITIGYYALVDHTQVNPQPDIFSDRCEWVPVDPIPEMVMDHEIILKKALDTLREHISHKPIGYSLLPETFTLPELQALYEAILGEKLNRGNFYRKIMRYDILIKLDEQRKGGAYKSPNLYKFDEEKYKIALSGLNW
ncbi:NUDIX domain-containing protein [Pedobacter petrophilus]|uniref:NUDIX domain-containing protein n=1 Tax=Pedobacter petrophilus TaxID=1908241 RepID=A0A7K0FVZ9_9SPHI|nr:NUDIX domain-containing protein [Pedobacter petrophilus]MRX75601.1 NUDIX domain-containing protein [Pedobacter petrophilus]